MEKRREFSRDTVEVCRNCKAEGTVEYDGFNNTTAKVPCPICCGSGLVRKRIVGFISIEPYVKTGNS